MEEKTSTQDNRLYKVVKSDVLSGPWNSRFVVVDSETNAILDDAQGYGYKSAQGAYKAYAFKQKHPNPKKYKQDTKKKVKNFVAKHQEIFNSLNDVIWYATKDGENISSKEIEQFLKDNGINEIPVRVSELLKYW